MKLCEICGATTMHRGTYRALDDAGRAVQEYPADECAKCGHIRPDANAVKEMPPSHVPSSVRIRCEPSVTTANDEPLHLGAGTGRVDALLGWPPASGNARRPTVLVVDDEARVASALRRVLTAAGYDVSLAWDGLGALEAVVRQPFDVIVSDVHMPAASGISLLQSVRSHDLDVPVILMTGNPTLDTAMEAVALGAMQYLAKPVANEDLVKCVERACRVHRLAKVKREALSLLGGNAVEAGDRAGLSATLDRALASLWMAFQPIVGVGERRIFGYEALLRSEELLMRSPADVLDAAERLGRLHELGRVIREKVAAAAAATEGIVGKLFVNLHSSDLNDDELYSTDAPLSKIASHVVLEITERASLDGVRHVSSCVARLKGLGFQIAIDDLGAGYAGLTSFTQLEPDIAKLDMSLVRGVDNDSRRQSIIRSMKSLCDELGMVVIAEGVETAAERDALATLGCDVLQGYFFGRPSRTFDAVAW